MFRDARAKNHRSSQFSFVSAREQKGKRFGTLLHTFHYVELPFQRTLLHHLGQFLSSFREPLCIVQAV